MRGRRLSTRTSRILHMASGEGVEEGVPSTAMARDHSEWTSALELAARRDGSALSDLPASVPASRQGSRPTSARRALPSPLPYDPSATFGATFGATPGDFADFTAIHSGGRGSHSRLP